MPSTNGYGSAGGSTRTVPVANGKASYAEKHNIADHFIGGNKLKNAPESQVKDFVAAHDGHTVITNVRYSQIEAHELASLYGRSGS
jgi:acetyl-CoA carboxylase / biotin carboxylase 1